MPLADTAWLCMEYMMTIPILGLLILWGTGLPAVRIFTAKAQVSVTMYARDLYGNLFRTAEQVFCSAFYSVTEGREKHENTIQNTNISLCTNIFVIRLCSYIIQQQSFT